MLFNMAVDGQAPAFFKRLTRGGVPLRALLATTVLACLCMFSVVYSPKAVYIWLLNFAGMMSSSSGSASRSATTASARAM